MMAALRVKGYVNQAGKLEFESPVGLVLGAVTITIEPEDEALGLKARPTAKFSHPMSWAHLYIETAKPLSTKSAAASLNFVGKSLSKRQVCLLEDGV
jgi:hypothetical protein